MDRVLPEAAQVGIGKVIEFAYSFEPYFAPTVVLGKAQCHCRRTISFKLRNRSDID